MRLHDSVIEDVVLRSLMHREIINDVNKGDIQLTEREIAVDETYREDLAAYRIYERDDLDWLIDLLAGRENREQPLPVGKTFSYPTLSYIREILRKYLNKP